MTVKPPAKSYKTFLFQNCSECSEAREKDFSYFYAINFQIDNEPTKSFALYFIDLVVWYALIFIVENT